MTPAEHIENLKIKADFAAKRIALAERLRVLADQLDRDIAFNSRSPCTGPHSVFRHLDTARAHVKAALVLLATQSLFPDGPRA